MPHNLWCFHLFSPAWPTCSHKLRKENVRKQTDDRKELVTVFVCTFLIGHNFKTTQCVGCLMLIITMQGSTRKFGLTSSTHLKIVNNPIPSGLNQQTVPPYLLENNLRSRWCADLQTLKVPIRSNIYRMHPNVIYSSPNCNPEDTMDPLPFLLSYYHRTPPPKALYR